MTTSGKLRLTVIEAKLTRDTELFGKMDPYCVITYRDTVLKTKVIEKGGKTPKWNEPFVIDVKYVGDDIKI